MGISFTKWTEFAADRIDLASYALPVALAMHKYTLIRRSPSKLMATESSGPVREWFSIANVAEYGTGFPIIPNAKKR